MAASICRRLRSLPTFTTLHKQGNHRGAAGLALAWDVEEAPALAADENGNHVSRGSQWVFLGSPGVGKTTYAAKLASLLHVPHISMGDLVRQEISRSTFFGMQLADAVSRGEMLSDDIALNILLMRLERGSACGEHGFILEGFPRTLSQAEILDEVADIDLALNLRLREDALVTKYLGRRVCSDCGKDFNLADIRIDDHTGGSTVLLPPILPPTTCLSKMTSSCDGTEEVIRERLQLYAAQNKPVEAFYRSHGKLLDFDVLGGVPETWTRLLAVLCLQDKEGTRHKCFG